MAGETLEASGKDFNRAGHLPGNLPGQYGKGRGNLPGLLPGSLEPGNRLSPERGQYRENMEFSGGLLRMRGQKRGDRRGRAGGKASGSGGDNRPQISGEQGKDPAGCGCGLYCGYPGKPGEEGSAQTVASGASPDNSPSDHPQVPAGRIYRGMEGLYRRGLEPGSRGGNV